MNIEIRRAKHSDIEGMSVVVDSAWRENYRDIFTDDVIDKFTGEHRRESFKGLIGRGVDIFVMTADGEIAALCAFQQTVILPDCAEIMLMYVHPKFQRRGFGGRLLMYSLNEMRLCGFVRAVLDTAKDNEGARLFYEKYGFTLQKEFTDGISYVAYMVEL